MNPLLVTSLHPLPPAPSTDGRAAFAARVRADLRELARRVQRGWFVWLPVLVLCFALHDRVGLNTSDSMPQRLVWLEHGAVPLRGDLVVLRADPHGPAAYLRGTRWFKRVLGLPGDRITVVGREVFINGASAGVAMATSPRGTKLEVIEAGVIPPGRLYVAGVSADSLDSRYAVVGLIRDDQIVARAHPLF